MKKLFSIVICFIMCINFSSVKIHADNTATILFLDDSIAYGYGLADGEKTYCEIIQDYYGSKVATENLAVNGYTTNDLIDLINNDEYADKIKKADVICVSIGGNDILDVFMSAMLDSLSNADESADITSSVKSLLTNPEKLAEFKQKLEVGASAASANFPVILKALREKNENARIIFQTIYNPFETAQDNPNSMFIRALYVLMQNYGGKMNTTISSLKNTETADISTLFAGSGWLATNINDYDIHPNQLGHIAIASQITSMLSGGKKSVDKLMPKLTKSTLSKEKFNFYYNMAEQSSDTDLIKVNPIILNSLGIEPPVIVSETTVTSQALSSSIQTQTSVVSVAATVITDKKTVTAKLPEAAAIGTEVSQTETTAVTAEESQISAMSDAEITSVELPEQTSNSIYYFFASIAVLVLILVFGLVKKFKK